MNRRRFLKWLGFGAAAPVVTKLPALEEFQRKAMILEKGLINSGDARVLWPGVKAFWKNQYKHKEYAISIQVTGSGGGGGCGGTNQVTYGSGGGGGGGVGTVMISTRKYT